MRKKKYVFILRLVIQGEKNTTNILLKIITTKIKKITKF